MTHGFEALRYNVIQRWTFYFRDIGKRTYFIDVIKDYGRICFANDVYLCYNKHI